MSADTRQTSAGRRLDTREVMGLVKICGYQLTGYIHTTWLSGAAVPRFLQRLCNACSSSEISTIIRVLLSETVQHGSCATVIVNLSCGFL